MAIIKRCMKCGEEYKPHIEFCAECGAVLVPVEENEGVKIEEEKPVVINAEMEDPVMIKEGELDLMKEFSSVLLKSGIQFVITKDVECGQGCCGNKCYLLVSEENAKKADAMIDEYYLKMHPEIQISKEMIDQGKCPACGHDVGPDTFNCPDCGLILIVKEEEK